MVQRPQNVVTNYMNSPFDMTQQRPVVSAFSRGTVCCPTVAGGEGGFWIWAWAFLGPVCIFLDPIESVWGDLVENCNTLHLFEEHANNCSTSVLMNDHWSSHVEAPWHVHITVITIFFPCLTHFDVLCAQMSTSTIGIKFRYMYVVESFLSASHPLALLGF